MHIIDLFDRSLVGWTIEDNESYEHAARLFRRIIRDLDVVPQIVHGDNGHPMRGATLAAFLDKLLVSRSYSRPRCSNDNAFIESWHKTLKHTVGYPKLFTSLDHARCWYANLFFVKQNSRLLPYRLPGKNRGKFPGFTVNSYYLFSRTIISYHLLILSLFDFSPTAWGNPLCCIMLS